MKSGNYGKGELLKLDHSIVDDQNSFVTFAAMAFF